MLIATESVAVNADNMALCTLVAQTLDEAAGRGIKSERLMGMYLLLRMVDKFDPYSVRDYALVLFDKDLTEVDKAHELQNIRVRGIRVTTGAA